MPDSSTKDYYQLLNVDRKATKEEIKAAYKSIALVYHPDSNFFDEILGSIGGKKAKEDNDALFKMLTAAYHTLVNPESRAEYDNTLAPELPSWSTEKVDIVAQKVANYNSNNSKMQNKPIASSAFGVFGAEVEDVEDEEYYSSTATFIGQRPPSFINRIFGLFKGR